ncbi:LysR family transcriptional regulator [Rhizobium sp. BK008]|jgi:DNA-binding transcriptional LysR family regulator|uniref:LysR family transcriptional regulator n=1 Tax=Rhizobium sp. BK008 TaxID=2587094 RepID=UPI0016083FAD|nr:LysR family transcriptional regulator [Rhizobium sp. BK008]MBB4255670.1 DNA-binding transcriptional LysR family regulator [Rhizobium sp. BK008]
MLHEIDLSRADLNLLVLFEAVYAERHVGRAAARLNLSTSAVSHGLGRLRRLLNDPLFLKTPKGVVPTERAEALAPGINEALRQVRSVVARAEPFDPATTRRRMVIGAPDGVSAVFLDHLVLDIARYAPGLDLGIRQLLPLAEDETGSPWRGAFRELETRAVDIAVIPSEKGPLRFESRVLYEEDFVLVLRRDHPFLARPTIEGYCVSGHLVVSHSGDPHGFVDTLLARHGLARRVALTVPNFMFACAIVGETDLICAVPRRFAERFAPGLGVAMTEPPLSLGEFRLTAFVPRSAMADAGLTWMLDKLGAAARGSSFVMATSDPA